MTLNGQNIITEMGELSNLAYISYGDQIVKGEELYGTFTKNDKDGKPVTFHLDGSYTVIDLISTGNSMEAVLLKNNDTGKFIIAFRGTQEPLDGVYDFTTGVLNFNPQISDATDFVNKMMLDYNIQASNLTLTGHSLGGILTQSVGATLKIQGYTFNAWASSNLIDYCSSHTKAA